MSESDALTFIDDTYIFTEIIRCGEIGFHAIKSFHKHHNLKIHIWCSNEDISFVPDHKNNEIHIIEKDSDLYKDFDSGHKGTSHLWTNLILDLPEKYKKIIHFDSDVYFRGNIVDDIVDGLKTHELVGPVRPYKNNPNNRDDIRKYPDVSQTFCFGFNREYVTQKNVLNLPINKETLWNWVRGYPTQFLHDVIDYFDPVSFFIIYNGGKFKIINENVIGGINGQGSRVNKYEHLNKNFDVGDKIIHFASVGSGLNFCKMIDNKNQINVPSSYVNYAINKYDIYSQLFFNNKILNTNENDNMVNDLKQFILE
jgi:hypothetical protein